MRKDEEAAVEESLAGVDVGGGGFGCETAGVVCGIVVCEEGVVAVDTDSGAVGEQEYFVDFVVATFAADPVLNQTDGFLTLCIEPEALLH